jgi:putative transposase
LPLPGSSVSTGVSSACRQACSRPRVSDDNAYVESLFRTAKYRPGFPARGFADLDAARRWAAQFVAWYNREHRHSGLRFVTPEQRHTGDDRGVLAQRAAVYEAAQQCHPRRWSRHTRNWTPVGAVTLNPDREAIAARRPPAADAPTDKRLAA